MLASSSEIRDRFHPAASISIGACARTAPGLGFNRKKFQAMPEDHTAILRAEEEKRLW
jgi:hypothetical protein